MKSNLLLFPVLTALAHAQSSVPAALTDPRGPYAALPHAFGLRTDSQLRSKPAGDQATPPAIYPVPVTPGVPVFRMDAMFSALWRSVLTLDDVSLGNDLIPLTSTWMLDPSPVGTTGWVAFLFSVTSATTGAGNGIISLRANGAPQAGADVYGTFVRGADTNPATEGIPPELVSVIQLQQGYEHLGLASGSSDLAALDPFIPLVAAGFHSGTSNGLLPNNLLQTSNGQAYIGAKFYFTVTPASAALINAQPSLQVTSPPRAVTPGDVLMITWGPNGWSAPTIFKAYYELGLGVGDDVTSLAVDATNPGGAVVCFTLASNGGTLRAARGSNSAVVRTTDGVPVKFLLVGDVDAICSYDPEKAAFHPFHGTPVAVAGPHSSIGLSLAANPTLTGYYAIVSGFGGAPTDGNIFLDVFDGISLTTVAGPIPRRAADHSVRLYLPYTWPQTPLQLWARASFVPTNGAARMSWVVKLDNY